MLDLKLRKLGEEAGAALAAAETLEELNGIRIRFLGKKGEVTQVLRGMGSLSAEERPRIGQVANEVRAGGAVQHRYTNLLQASVIYRPPEKTCKVAVKNYGGNNLNNSSVQNQTLPGLCSIMSLPLVDFSNEPFYFQRHRLRFFTQN